MAKMMISLPEMMIKKIEFLSTREMRSKSELIREALRCYDWVQNQKLGTTLEEAERKQLIFETDQIAAKIGKQTKGWDTTAAIRKMRDSR